MGSYSYKFVRDKLPPYITDGIDDYEAGAGYDGDMWNAADNYIKSLENELALQFKKTYSMADAKLFEWLQTRPKSIYTEGPVITPEMVEEAGEALVAKLNASPGLRLTRGERAELQALFDAMSDDPPVITPEMLALKPDHLDIENSNPQSSEGTLHAEA